MSSIIDVFSHNAFLWAVLACALVAGAIAIERVHYLFLRATVAPAPFYAEVQRLVLDGNIDRAIRHTRAEPRSPLANALHAALLHANRADEDVALAIEAAMLESTPAIQTRIGYLATLANVVTLFGLLGTIVGLILSFQAVTDANMEEKQTLLAAGIAIAMHTTAGGIAVAIPTLLAYSLLVQRGNRLLDEAEQYAMRLRMLLRSRRSGPAEALGAAPAAALGASPEPVPVAPTPSQADDPGDADPTEMNDPPRRRGGAVS
jgi:biopolymer transport protein ExbB/TolQ